MTGDRLAAEYGEWARGVARRGIPIDGHELAPERRVVRNRTAANAGEAAARVGGYFIVQADDVSAARRLAETHPHIGYGGWIEVAEVL